MPPIGTDLSLSNSRQITCVDFADLSSEHLTALQFCVGQFRLNQHRMLETYFASAQLLFQIKEIVGGDRFMEFATTELGLKPRTIQRYMRMDKTLLQHFSENGQINVKEASMFTQRALLLLSPETDEEIISEIKALVNQGEIINESTVRRIIDRHDADLEAQVVSAQAETEFANTELKKVTERSELLAARLQNQLNKQDEQVRRLTEQRSALEEEIEVLKKQETVVTEKTVEVEVVPAGFKSAQEATEAAQKQLALAIEKKDRVDAEILEAEGKRTSILENVSVIEAGNEEFLKIKSQIDGILLKYPAALLRAVSNSSPTAKTALENAADAMILLGNQLRSAVLAT